MKMQSKTMLRFHLTPQKWQSLRNKTVTNAMILSWKKTSLLLMVRMQTSTTIIEISLEISQRMKLEILNDPVTPWLGIFPVEFKVSYYNDIHVQ